MSFGEALKLVLQGKIVARKGWNGKKMFIWLNKGSVDFSTLIPQTETIGGIPLELFEKGYAGTVTRLPNLNMKDAGGSTVTGWLASQADMLADDWEEVQLKDSI